MVSTEVPHRIADAAGEAGNYQLARQLFERGAALGDGWCLMTLGYMYDVGEGVPADEARAMQLYRRAWRKGCSGAANNIAILYREQGKRRAMFQWFKREADAGDGGAYVDLAKCYLAGTGVRKDFQAALRCLAMATAPAVKTLPRLSERKRRHFWTRYALAPFNVRFPPIADISGLGPLSTHCRH